MPARCIAGLGSGVASHLAWRRVPAKSNAALVACGPPLSTPRNQAAASRRRWVDAAVQPYVPKKFPCLSATCHVPRSFLAIVPHYYPHIRTPNGVTLIPLAFNAAPWPMLALRAERL